MTLCESFIPITLPWPRPALWASTDWNRFLTPLNNFLRNLSFSCLQYPNAYSSPQATEIEWPCLSMDNFRIKAYFYYLYCSPFGQFQCSVISTVFSIHNFDITLEFNRNANSQHTLKSRICCSLLECEARHRGIKKSPMLVPLGFHSNKQGPTKKQQKHTKEHTFCTGWKGHWDGVWETVECS